MPILIGEMSFEEINVINGSGWFGDLLGSVGLGGVANFFERMEITIQGYEVSDGIVGN